MKKLWAEIWGFVMWTHDRGGLRYDIMVGLILAFIFFTPRTFFKDRPAPPSSEQVQVLDNGAYRLDSKLLAREERNLEDGARRALKTFTGREVKIRRLEPVLDDENHIQAYHVWIEEKP